MLLQVHNKYLHLSLLYPVEVGSGDACHYLWSKVIMHKFPSLVQHRTQSSFNTIIHLLPTKEASPRPDIALTPPQKHLIYDCAQALQILCSRERGPQFHCHNHIRSIYKCLSLHSSVQSIIILYRFWNHFVCGENLLFNTIWKKLKKGDLEETHNISSTDNWKKGVMFLVISPKNKRETLSLVSSLWYKLSGSNIMNHYAIIYIKRLSLSTLLVTY